jgi:RHS repeat-associated protein
VTAANQLPTLSLPAGSGAQSPLGTTLSPDGFSGGSALSIPITVTPVRSITPELSLTYSSGAHNGAFGLGFNVALPSIAVRLETGVPRYDGTDQFVLDGGEVLVPRLVQTPDGWVPDRSERSENGETYLVTLYRTRVETSHTRIEQWLRLSDGDLHWRSISTENATYVFGQSRDARIFDPTDPAHVSEWLCESLLTDFGDMALYRYKADNAENIPNHPSSADRSNVAQKYPSEIRYGAYDDTGTTKFSVIVVFDYGEYDYAPSNPDPFVPVRTWPARPDPFSTYRAGFEIRTNRLCRAVMVFHHVPELGPDPLLMGVTSFVYRTVDGMSLLGAVDYTGYGHDGTGNVETISVPTISFGYQPFAPEAQRFVPLHIEDSQPPANVGSAALQLVDLYCDGLPGLLSSTNTQFLYWRNEGGGRFGPPASPDAFPNNRDLADADVLALTDLNGNGLIDLVVNQPGGQGYFANEGQGVWSSFRAFAATATEVSSPDAELVDLDGSGRAELVVMEPQSLRYYPGLGSEGFGPPVNLSTAEPLPNPSAFRQTSVVRFADMFGDGGSHLVRVRNGQVVCWPNLGHGRFAPPVLFDNAPHFPGAVEAARILIGDFTGSGAADIVYVGADAVYLYASADGDGFAEPVVLPLPGTFGPSEQATAGDVYGNGTACLVVSGPEQEPAALDFTGGNPPHLMIALDNGMGGTTSFRYAASTRFMLEDRAAGKPWPEPLPFPVQVLVETTTDNPFSANLLRTRMAYHDGYYDREQRKFRGFGYTETWVDEIADGLPATPATYTRAWYQTGAYKDQDAFYARYRSEFYSGDPEELILPPSKPVTLSSPPDPQALVEAQSALAGNLIRNEIYGLDGASNENVPYTVEERNYTMRELQPRTGRNYAVFQVEPRESISFAYERVPDDPRVTQNFSLEVNEYNQVTLAANVAYPRRPDHISYPEQLVLGANATRQSFAVNIGAGYLPLEPAEEQSFTLGNLSRGAGLYFTFDEIGAQVEVALQNIIPPEAPFTGSTPQARQRAWTRHYYWNADQSAKLGLYEVTSPALPYSGETIELSVGTVAAVYGSKLTDQQIAEDGYYVLDQGYWWNPGAIMGYAGAAQFYLPQSTTTPNGTNSSVTYDAYAIMAVASHTPDGTSTAVPDYQSFQPLEVTDVNGNVTQMLTDALGRPVVSTTFRVNGDGTREGDDDVSTYRPVPDATLTSVIAAPQDYLQGMTVYYFHSFAPAPGQPPTQLAVQRQFHVSDLPPGTESPMRLAITYFNIDGETLETKQQVDAAATGSTAANWLVTGRTLAGAQGQALRVYLPGFEDVPEFTFYASGLYDTGFYDALLRRIELLTAKGFISRDVFAAWSTVRWDLDDAVKTSPYYQTHIDDMDPAFADQRDALIKAAVFEDTPVTQVLDPLGRTVRIEQVDLSVFEPEPVTMTTLSVLNAEGDPVKMADPRFTAGGGVPTIWNVTTVYDLSGNGILVASVDSGSRTIFYDAMGLIAHQWDASDRHLERLYDAMGRPSDLLLYETVDTIATVETYAYGSDAADNSIGRLVERCDQSGITTFASFNLAGQPEIENFALRVAYAGTADWSGAVPVEPPLTATQVFDALGEIIAGTRPDGSALAYTYYSTGWIAELMLTLSEGAPQPVASDIEYNAFAKPTRARYGSGIEALRSYEDTTGNLTGIFAQRVGDGTALQDITYAYDPVGNVTSAEDRTIPLVFCNQSQVSPKLDYTYSAIYRLLLAKGRENPGITATTYLTGFKQSVYMPLCPTNPNDDVKLIPYQEAYSYDLSGNLQSIRHETAETALSWTREMTTSTTSDRTVLAGGLPPDESFDLDGNLIFLSDGRPLAWSWGGTLSSAVIVARDQDPNDADFFVYDSSGQRRRKVMCRLTQGGMKVQDVVYFAGVQLYRDVPDAGAPEVTRQGLMLGEGDDRLLMVYQWPDGSNPAQFRYQLSTALDCVALEVDATGGVISYEEYFPYGGTAIIAGDSMADVELKYYRFTGKECDDGSGLYYFGARYYASWLGRWISCDPSGPADALNLYEYVGCNPISATDPTGNGKETTIIPLDPDTVTAFKASYHYLSAPVVATYEQLTLDLHQYVYAHPQLMDDPTSRFTPQLEQRILDMFDAHKDLHLGKNPELRKLWDISKSHVTLTSDAIKNYTKIRSPHFTEALAGTDLDEIIKDPQFFRTVELHHGAKKSIRPEIADIADNLWALTRGGSSYGVLGQHDSAFHLVGAAGFGNRYTTEVAAYSGLMMHWEDIQSLPGPAPGLPPPPPVFTTPLPLLTLMTMPVVATFPAISPVTSPTVAATSVARTSRKRGGGKAKSSRSSRSTPYDKTGRKKRKTTVTYVRKSAGGGVRKTRSRSGY